MATAKSTTEDMEDSKGKSKSDSTNTPSFNMDEIRALADLVDERGLTDFEFENELIRVRLSKTAAPQAVQSVAPQVVQTAATATTSAPEGEATDEPDPDDGLEMVVSPIVGTFYRSPSPEKPPYVKEGDHVSEDTVVCIVEAMKLMNEIQAETTGKIVKVFVENGQAIEYGQPLFGISK